MMDYKNTTVEQIMILMTQKFAHYAKKRDADGKTLNTDELYDLAVVEFPTLSKIDEVLKVIIGKMDVNNDKKVTFEEFMHFTASMAIALERH